MTIARQIIISPASAVISNRMAPPRGQNEQYDGITGARRPLRGAGADDLAHQQAQIVAGDMEEIALLDVLPAAQMGAPHAATIQDMGKRALEDLSTQLEALSCDA